MASKKLIEVRITGNDITPGKIRSRDVGDLIIAIESMVAALVARDNPTLQLNENEVTVGLSAIEHGSYILVFESEHEDAVINASQLVADSINTNNYSKVPVTTRDAIEKIRKVARKYHTDIEFWQRNGEPVRLTTVNTNTQIDTSSPTISGKTTLYGTVISVGGESPPRATLRLLSGDKFTCHITEREDFLVPRKLGEKLYKEVGVFGMARWDLRNMALDYFLIEQVTDYAKKPIDQALGELNQIVGKYYDSIDDADALVAEIRGTNEEDS
jgi:hypothetical protein